MIIHRRNLKSLYGIYVEKRLTLLNIKTLFPTMENGNRVKAALLGKLLNLKTKPSKKDLRPWFKKQTTKKTRPMARFDQEGSRSAPASLWFVNYWPQSTPPCIRVLCHVTLQFLSLDIKYTSPLLDFEVGLEVSFGQWDVNSDFKHTERLGLLSCTSDISMRRASPVAAASSAWTLG